MKSLFGDEQLRPDLFVWNGAISASTLENWLRVVGWNVPEELRSFWERTGGGDAFETETFLGPFGDSKLGGNVVGVNAHHRSRGMSPDYLIFHTGLGGLSAVRLEDGAFVVLNDTDYWVTAEYKSFDCWYFGHIRREYAERYELPR